MISLREDCASFPPPPPRRAAELAAQIFADTGCLVSELGLEHRPQQEIMARAVASAMEDDDALLFEAGTGVGKSLAYLIPGIIHAVDQTRQLVVSTHTISLQEQIETCDLPLCRRVFASVPGLENYAAFRSALLVGKSNYLCTSRLATALRDRKELFATPEHVELDRIADWAERTADGLRHELTPPPLPDVWDWVNADSSACSRKHCDCERCFYQRARARLRKANVVIVNHSLLFSLINAGGASEKGAARGVLFPDDFVVIDEAHTVAEVATEHFGLRLSSYGIDRMLKHLFNPKTRRGLLVKHGGALEQQLVLDALEAAEQFFGHLRERLLAKQPVVRIREADCCEPWLDGPLAALTKAVDQRANSLEEGRERDELLEQRGRLKTCQAGLRQWLSMAGEGSVYWVERTGRRQVNVLLRSAPLDVAPGIREAVLERGTSVVFTSATLAVGGDIRVTQQRIGAGAARTRIVESPFDYPRNMRVYVASDIPLPSPGEARLAMEQLIDYIRFATLRVPGGSLVLFTSYRDLKAAAEALEDDYRRAGRPFFAQGQDLSRTELARRLRAAGDGVLFGTDSFWTGVDIPGPALSQIVITRLPFDPPTHPVAEAKSEWIQAKGGSAFNDLTLPDALIKFRQGVGRLIRSATDRGVVTILDSRILAKTYGRYFLGSLPVASHIRLTRENRDAQFQPFP